MAKKRRVDVLDIKQDVKDGLLKFYVKDGKIYASEVLHGKIGDVSIDGELGDTMMVGLIGGEW